MARFNRSIRPVNSLKHVVDTATSAVAGGVTSTVILAQAVQNPSLGNVEEINWGSVINSIYARVELLATNNSFSSVPRVYMSIMKNPGNNLAVPYPANVGASDNKRFVIHQEMTMVGGNGSTTPFPRTMFAGVVKIPKGYRRFGVNDRLLMSFSLDVGDTGGISNACVQCIYKEFF